MSAPDQVTFAEDEAEADRLERLAEWEKDGGEPLIPGTLGFHEAFHMASVLSDSVDRHLLGHPAILNDKELFAQVHLAFSALWSVYQTMGQMVRDDDGPDDPEAGERRMM